jgi:serine phosphatase RsbU (regulator of sigma subunit)
VFKVKIKTDKEYIFRITIDKFEFNDKELETIVLNDITELERMNKELEELYKHTKDSIDFASLIQRAMVPIEEDMKNYFKDEFAIWLPKDIVGGDVWSFESLRNKDECLLMVIDCTGHGVPGAFVTMIVKAIEREIVSKLQKHKEFDISPAIILEYFNKTMKKLLKQDNEMCFSNAGFDGCVIYYNRREQILKFAGANIPLFYVEDNKVKMLKGDRYSVGYKQCDFNHKYKEKILNVKEGMKFYVSTDGYIDQIGGEKDFPFGKKRFQKLIEQYHNKPMEEQKKIFLDKWEEYKGNYEQVDDITLIGFEIDKRSDINEKEIFRYEGVITQNVISMSIDNIENSIDNLSIVSKLSTLTIEMCQNIMNYSNFNGKKSHGYIEIREISTNHEIKYEIITKNMVNEEEKIKIENRLNEISNLTKKEIKQKYKELRKSGEYKHKRGGGIGFYEIAKIADNMQYFFEKKQNGYLFVFKVGIVQKLVKGSNYDRK